VKGVIAANSWQRRRLAGCPWGVRPPKLQRLRRSHRFDEFKSRPSKCVENSNRAGETKVAPDSPN